MTTETTETITADRRHHMNTSTLAAGIVGFLLGGLVVSVAAELEDERPDPPAHGSPRPALLVER